ncbi:4140_t:CDS:2 [Acaulospora morrowiae]|uniref:4140_t:CDS:1 n=1 Tax=Acaulospora morrowiae TaxID=94023 RepID=A0A9N9A4S9_9GLOM|nr:4140_t:CDS:2 [Acaulospora morrowiae]
MSTHSEQITTVTPENDGPSFPAFLAKPKEGSGPGLILLTENLDISQEIEREAILFSQEGYVVLVPDLSTISLDGQDGNMYTSGIINHLANLPEKIGKIGIIGRGRGASVAIKLAASASSTTQAAVSCGVAYYPTNLKEEILELAKIKGPFMVHLADGCDESIKEELKNSTSQNNLISIFEYPGVDYGFASPNVQAPPEVQTAVNTAYTRSLRLLKKIMGPYYDLSALWDKHIEYEFLAKDTQKTVETMVEDAYVNHIPTMTGGVGREHLEQFYHNHFIHSNPTDTRMIPISRTIGIDRVVDEMVVCFTHTQEVDWILPGIPPTNKYVQIPLVVIIHFRGDKLCSEHIYWDQASVLVQIGLLNKEGLPVTGGEQAENLLSKNLKNNELLKKFKKTE